MHVGVPGVFPALLDKPIRRVAGVLDKSIAISIAIAFQPIQGMLDVGPNRSDKIQIMSAFEIGAGEHDKQRRRVNGAVVTGKWYFSEGGHFACARFMHDLSRLGVPVRIDGLRLGRC